MSKSSKSNNLTVKDALAQAKQLLNQQHIPSSQLDAELILATTLNIDRILLHAHPERALFKKDYRSYFQKIKQRQKRIPLAYILGWRDFYGRSFLVNRHTLIPRPESENVIEVLKNSIQKKPFCDKDQLTLLDVGTGSGCLGITAKLEIPSLNVYLSDVSQQSLRLAQKNSQRLQADTKTLKSNLLQKINITPDIILANLPYVDRNWDCLSPEIFHEPPLALFASNNGLAIIFDFLSQAPLKASADCLIIIEADPRQHQAIISFAKQQSLQLQTQLDYILAFIKNSVISKNH